jgi:FKBP-type peptidyl-prolyl cis-trans isomerase FklB
MFRTHRFAVCLLAAAAAPAFAQDAKQIMTEKDKMSYAIGIAFGRSLLQTGAAEITYEQVSKGMADAFAKRKMQLTEDEFRVVYATFQKQMVGKMGHARNVAALQNQQAGQKYMADNKDKPGVVTTASGLQYKVITPGSGPKPTDDDTVVVNYRGTLVDGTEFDSTYKRNKPATFPLRGAIAGWREALKMMPTGAKWELYIPAELAYLRQSVGELIGPNSTLIFEIELLSFEKTKK